jgi:hypothetical protein
MCKKYVNPHPICFSYVARYCPCLLNLACPNMVAPLQVSSLQLVLRREARQARGDIDPSLPARFVQYRLAHRGESASKDKWYCHHHFFIM